MFAFVAWRNPGLDTTITVGDDTHSNVWHPLGAPVAASPVSGFERVSVWYTRNPGTAATVYFSPDGYCPAMAACVVEYSGLSPWATVSALSPDLVNNGTTLTMAAPAPAGMALAFAVAGYDNIPLAPALTATGDVTWTALPAVTVSNGGSDHSNDCGLTVAWTASSSSPDATFTAGGNLNMAGLVAGVLVTGDTPAAESQTWPYVQMQAAVNGGAATPWDALSWSDLSARYQSLTASRGQQYELDTIQSGTAAWKLTNNDGALTPGRQSSPYYLGTSGWAVPGSARFTPSAAYAFQGRPTAVFSPDGVTPAPVIMTAQGAASPGWRCFASAVLFCPSGWAEGANVTIGFNDSSGTQISSASGARVSLPRGRWTQVTVSGTAPAGTAAAVLIIGIAGTPLVSTRIWVAAAPLIAPTGAIINPNPWFTAGVQAYTPVRLLYTWPPPPALNARTYSLHRAFMQKWPQELTTSRFQVTSAQSVDVWTLTTQQMKSLARAEILADNPVLYCPCDDDAGATAAANQAPTPAAALQVVTSKYGPGSSVQEFGADASALQGDPDTSSWQVQGQTVINAGYCLYTGDPLLPSLAEPDNPVTIEAWFSIASAQPAGQLSLLAATAGATTGAGNTIAQVTCDSATGHLKLVTGPWPHGAGTAVTFSTRNWLGAGWFHLAIVLDTGTPVVYVNGVPQTAVFGSTPGPATWGLSVAGVATPFEVGGMVNTSVAHIAVYPRGLDASRIMTHYLAALTGMAGLDTSGQRIERLLATGSAAFPRVIPAGADIVVGATDVADQAAGQNVVNITQSDSGLFFVDACGYLSMLARRDGYNLPVLRVFGEQPAQPLNKNPAFPGTISPWTAANGGAIAYSTAFSRAPGTGAAQLTPDGVTAAPLIQTEAIPVTAGVSYTGTAWVMSPQGWTSVTGVLAWLDGGGSPLPGTVTGVALPAYAGVPARITVSGRAPAGAVTAVLQIVMQGTPPGTAVLLAAAAPFTTTATEYPYQVNFATGFDPAQVVNDVELDQVTSPVMVSYPFKAHTTANLFYSAGTSLALGDQVTLTGSSLPSPFTTGVTYFVVSPVGPTFQLAATQGGSPIMLTSNGSGTLTVTSAPNGVTVTTGSQSSQGSFGDNTFQESTYLADPAVITDQGWWIAWTSAAPQTRIVVMFLDPSVNEDLWPVVLGLECGQVVYVHRRLQATEPQIEGLFQIATISNASQPRKFGCTVTLIPYPGQVLTCDDLVAGVLDGENALPW